MGEWEQTDHGPRLVTASSWADVELESAETVGWSDLVDRPHRRGACSARTSEPLVHRRGRYQRPGG